MADTEWTVDGVLVHETTEQEWAVDGVQVVETTAAAPPAGGTVNPFSLGAVNLLAGKIGP